MSSPKEEQERVKSLLLDTVTLLCKNGLTFKKHLKVEGLLGITLDEENVFIVHFNENCGEVTVEVTNEDNGASKTVNARRNSSEHKSQKRKKRKSSSDYREPPEKIQLKTESDVIFLENDEDEDVKPFASQNFVPYQNSSTVFPNYGPIPMTPTQHLSPMIGLNNSVGQFTPGGVIGSAAQLPGPHTGMPNFSQDSSSLTTQMTPEKLRRFQTYGRLYRDKNSTDKAFECLTCGNKYYEKHNLKRHMRLKHAANDGKGLLGPQQETKLRDRMSTNKPHVCLYPNCDKSFYEKHNLIRHIKGAHLVTNYSEFLGRQPTMDDSMQSDSSYAGDLSLRDMSTLIPHSESEDRDAEFRSSDTAIDKAYSPTGNLQKTFTSGNENRQDSGVFPDFGGYFVPISQPNDSKCTDATYNNNAANTRSSPQPGTGVANALPDFGGYFVPVSQPVDTRTNATTGSNNDTFKHLSPLPNSYAVNTDSEDKSDCGGY